ncbi:helix-turn-helix domain-containing protein [Streptomyces palmae]|uniref:helix-turn-helix domain-containing protein n=1 Tax=Streptomyces palmae TaxID=1701085 RepID=UPI001FD73ACC|nr:helix-turn-helix transcriptional regulator [Streptomyces palmae]
MGSEEVDRFAERLRELKERSGRSYGTLAARLHISASTLHRYCHADAVPARFALVERLARLCGASPEELLELHRRWLLADAARRAASARGGVPGRAPRRGAAAGGVVLGRVPADPGAEATPPDRLPGGSWEDRPESPTPEDRPRPRAQESRLDVPASEVRPESPAAEDRPVPPGREVRPEPPAPGVRPVPRVGASPPRPAVRSMARTSAVPPAPRPTADTPRRRRPAWALLVGAAGSLVLAAVAVGPLRGGDQRTGAGEGTSAPPAPLALSTRSHVWENGCDHRYLINRPPSRVAAPPVEQSAPAWAAAHGAVHGGSTNVEVTVAGRGRQAVVLRALQVRVVERRAPLAWSSFAMDNGCGGALTPRTFAVDLDAARPLARPTDGFDGERTLPAVRLPYRVSATDPEVLLVNARTQGCDCSWYLELDWAAGGRSGTVRIDDGGKPFRTSGTTGRPQYGYAFAEQVWRRDAP